MAPQSNLGSRPSSALLVLRRGDSDGHCRLLSERYPPWQGVEEYEIQKTDVHYFSQGDAEFNWRMTWPMALPEKSPRLFLQVWDHDLIGANDAIGEAQLNLRALCDKAVKRGGAARQEATWIPCTHPNFKEVQARVKITIELLPQAEKIMKPAGKGRSEPNAHPYLPEPVRPNFFDSIGLNLDFLNPFNLLKRYRMYVAACCCCVLGLFVLFMLFQAQSAR